MTTNLDEHLQALLTYLRKDADAIGRMDEKLEMVMTDVEKLERILVDGDGSSNPSLLVIIARVQFDLGALQQASKAWETSRKEQIQSRAAIVISIIGALTSLLIALFQKR